MATKRKKTSPSAKGKALLTREGFEKLQRELDRLIHKRRPYVVARIQRAREMGDLSENGEYDAARDEQAFVEGRIQELTEVLRHVEIIKEETKPGFVIIGSRVVVEFGGEQDEFTIVGSLEADPLNGKISNESPVGKALLGAKVGEVIEVSTPVVKTVYTVVTIK